MKVLRFDASVGRQVDAHDSDFRMSPIALLEVPIRTFAFHLEVGGRVGRHVLASPQLLLVTAGSGWAAGPDGDPVRVTPGLAVHWEAGEEHEVWTDYDELTAIVLEGEVALWAPPANGDPVPSVTAPEPVPSEPAHRPEPLPSIEGEVTTVERRILGPDGSLRPDLGG